MVRLLGRASLLPGRGASTASHGLRGMCTAVSFADGTSFSLWMGALQAAQDCYCFARLMPASRCELYDGSADCLTHASAGAWAGVPCRGLPDHEFGAEAAAIKEHILLQLNPMEVDLSAHTAIA